MTVDPSPPTTTSAPAVLEIAELRKSYGKAEVLRGLNLSVRQGEVYGFLGRNGAGKSTTLRIVMGISKASSGSVRLFGEPSAAQRISLRQRIGYVAQEQNFYGWMTPRTIGKFVAPFYPTWEDREYERLIDRMELPLGQKIRTFSGGMKVKLGLAMALAHRPKLLVLDEPMAGLDPVARREFLEMVRSQAERSARTTFFSTHLIDEIELAAHRVGIVDGGRTLYEGTVEALAASVRLLRHPPSDAEPELPGPLIDPEGGFDVVSQRTRRGEHLIFVRTGEPARFAALLEPGSPWRLEEASLEDVFVELVRRPLAD